MYMLAFDHRGSFEKGMFGIDGQATEEQQEKIRQFKQVIYQGFKKGIELGIPKEHAAILVDEQYGGVILSDAKAQGCTFCVGVEKSGQEEFSFEFGQDFASHIEKFDPPIVKALVRYNPEGDKGLNGRQLANLKVLSDYCHQHGRKLLVEPLVGPTEDELKEFGGDKERFDQQLRPMLEAGLIEQFQAAGVEVDIWKVEGLSEPEQYEAATVQARSGGRNNVAVIVLGRGASQQQVDKWLEAGKGVAGVKGFAIGRTIFWEPLADLRDGKIDAEAAAGQIAQNYLHFYQVFTQ